MKTETFEKKALVSTEAQFNMNGSVQGLGLTKRLGIESFWHIDIEYRMFFYVGLYSEYS